MPFFVGPSGKASYSSSVPTFLCNDDALDIFKREADRFLRIASSKYVRGLVPADRRVDKATSMVVQHTDGSHVVEIVTRWEAWDYLAAIVQCTCRHSAPYPMLPTPYCLSPLFVMCRPCFTAVFARWVRLMTRGATKIVIFTGQRIKHHHATEHVSTGVRAKNREIHVAPRWCGLLENLLDTTHASFTTAPSAVGQRCFV